MKIMTIGLTMIVAILLPGLASAAPIETVLHTFQYPPRNDGEGPANVVRGSDGSLYGTTGLGGISGYGVIYRITPDGVETVLHEFSAVDGSEPGGPLAFGPDGQLYGTTSYDGPGGAGTVFRIATDGSGFTTLHAFRRQGHEPHGQLSGLVLATDGSFYGTSAGGTFNEGTIYRMSLDGEVQTVHEFHNSVEVDGNMAPPGAPLVQGSDGTLYGVTVNGGTWGCGTLYRLSQDGTFATLHEMTGSDGCGPQTPLEEGLDGAMYGTAPSGGSSRSHAGTAFKLDAGDKLTVIHFFGETPADPVTPASGLRLNIDGNFYGTTLAGENVYATIYKMTPQGAVTTLHKFIAEQGGYNPQMSRFELNALGQLFGTTTSGGEPEPNQTGAGVVYEFTP